MSQTNDNSGGGDDSNVHDDGRAVIAMMIDETDDGQRSDTSNGPIMATMIPSLVAAAASKDMGSLQEILRAHPDVNAWMDPLIVRLLPTISSSSSSSSSSTATTPDEALLAVGTLAQLDPETYLLPISKSFARRVAQVTTITPGEGHDDSALIISPALLTVWMQQLTQTSQVAVHSLLLKALIQVIRVQGPVLAHAALQELVGVWQYHWSSMTAMSGTNAQASSIVSVRCAATFVECIVALGDVALSVGKSVGATSLMTGMLQHHEDPLLQLSILDLFPEHFQSTTELQGATRAWLTSPEEVVQPILELLEDPLLEGAALQCASWIATLDCHSGGDGEASSLRTTTLRTRVLHHIEEKGVLSSESDRLAVVQALVEMSKAAPAQLLDAIILKREGLRCAWWDMRRLSSPKLQAAILSSVAQVISSLRPSPTSLSEDHTTIGTQMYSFLARDNGISVSSSTTDWLYTKYSKSPIPELRIATYAVWAAVAGLGINGATVLSTSTGLWELLLEGGREGTPDARVAKYEVLEHLYENARGFLATPLQTKLKKLLELGPHGVRAVAQWDVALE